MTDITVTDTPHGLHLDTDGGTPVTLSPDTVAAIVQHELGKLGRVVSANINAILTMQAVNQGDHAQDITTAIAVDPSETVGDLLARTCTKREWRAGSGERPLVPDGDAYLTLRLAVDYTAGVDS